MFYLFTPLSNLLIKHFNASLCLKVWRYWTQYINVLHLQYLTLLQRLTRDKYASLFLLSDDEKFFNNDFRILEESSEQEIWSESFR